MRGPCIIFLNPKNALPMLYIASVVSGFRESTTDGPKLDVICLKSDTPKIRNKMGTSATQTVFRSKMVKESMKPLKVHTIHQKNLQKNSFISLFFENSFFWCPKLDVLTVKCSTFDKIFQN